MKTCSKCKTSKEETCFKSDTSVKSGLRAMCKECDVIRTKEWRHKNPDKVRGYGLKQVFDMSIDEYNRLFENQKGCCKICGVHQSLFKRSLAVDHCHLTNQIRGLLCSNCNTALGLTKDNVQVLENMIMYLTEMKPKPKPASKK